MTNNTKGLALSLWIGFAATAFVVAPPAHAAKNWGQLAGGGPLPPSGPCVSDEQRARMDAEIADYFRSHPEETLLTAPAKFPFRPFGATDGDDVLTVNYVDLGVGSGLLDWDCTTWTYDGHLGHDTGLRSFAEQDVGVPIFAALDGRVVSVHDGEFDRNTCFPSCPPNTNPNYVTIDHGNGRVCRYLHMRQGSVAVLTNQTVRAGQQIGLIGSSGLSSGPHLHFETQDNGFVIEPFAGPCRSGDSQWVNQSAHIDHTTFLGDFGLSYQDPGAFPPPPNPLPRSGQIALSDPYVYPWIIVAAVPPSSTWRTRFQRPDGSIAFDSGDSPFNNSSEMRDAIFWWIWDIGDMHTITGTWHVLFSINGVQLAAAPLEVRTARTSDFNRPPSAIGVSFEPAAPTIRDAVFCRVSTDPVLDDPDYDVVRYHYVWTVDGSLVVRDVTTAGHADAIPHDEIPSTWTTLRCTVTPNDGLVDGPSAYVEATSCAIGDTSAPVIACPADITVTCARRNGASVTYTVGATDDCDPQPTIACSPTSGSTFPLGTTLVQCSATDLAANVATCSFHVDVTDSTNPSFTYCPSDISATCSGGGGAAVTYQPLAFDSCDQGVPVVCVPASGSTFPVATTPVVCTATDRSGNSATCSFDVIVTETGCGMGTVNAGAGAVADVLRLNGSAGSPCDRAVSVSIGGSIEVALDSAPAGPASGRYALWVWLGPPSNSRTLVAHSQTLGCTIDPTPLERTLAPQPFRCLRGGTPPVACGRVQELRSPARTPWVVTRSQGMPQQMTLSFQGILEDTGAGNTTGYSVTNAVTLRIE
jgi:peptidase M23-like protein/HYR domain-containing protein